MASVDNSDVLPVSEEHEIAAEAGRGIAQWSRKKSESPYWFESGGLSSGRFCATITFPLRCSMSWGRRRCETAFRNSYSAEKEKRQA